MTATREPVVAACPGPARSLSDVLVQDRQGHVAEQRGEDRTLRGSGAGFPQQVILIEDPGLEERLDQGQYAFVPDSCSHSIQQSGMRDFVEAALDVALHDPLIGAGREVAYLGDRVVSPAVRAEPVGTREEIRLEDRL